MWKGPGQDPGGGSESGPPPASSQELSDLKDQFEQQQVLIAQLKEMLRKSEQSSVTQEKVDEYMNTLSKRGGKAKKARTQDDRKTLDIPASQKISLLRQQVEENKARFAERGKSQKGIEEMVSQLKAQLDDSQQMILSPLNLSLQDSKIEYSETSSAHELYTVLLSKEKRVSDLLAKVQKLESSVLDLQENVKEKDSVIDARTKAISLMTENLSRKNKTSLDALDDTKEQMRKMQENFVLLESEMKARQMKLLDDLKLKNYEIAELEEVNGLLRRQVDEAKPQDDCNDLEALRTENRTLLEALGHKESLVTDLQAKLKQKIDDEAQNCEVEKLRKQLEESNKSMIKVKAQHKSKVKELTKKIDAFKKIADVNAELVKLEAENCRLNHRVAELEEEKGSLQLKLVETDSNKGSEATERENELEAKIQDQALMLDEKDKIISILEIELSRAKTETDALSEKLNTQVTSEMASIQFEEQVEALENDKRNLIAETERLSKQLEQLLEAVDQLKKEKQEISTKLEHCVQENIELVDKLEKLSAEKVSSAESIEIVEGLTQQEKLELAAYQKSLDLKASEENLPQGDLNESVNELTEETSELLQKIELFTVERREVMEKMEQLKLENNDLSLKINQVENNREVLAETYEQLQSDKEALDDKLETLEAENASLKEQLQQMHKEKLEREFSEADAKERNELEEEIVLNKTIIEEKQYELDSVKSLVQDLENQLAGIRQENNRLNNNIAELSRTVSELENENQSYQHKINELEEQSNNLTQLVEKSRDEIETISNADWENRRLIESKDNELTKLMKERDNTESVIQNLQKTIKDKDEKFHKVSSELKDKYLSLQKQLADNSDGLKNVTAPLQARIEELTAKNKEQLDKMKKLAANLKKKTQAHQELEEKLRESQTRHETELGVSLHQLQDLESEVARLQQRFDDKADEARVLQQKNVELQNIVADLRVKADKSGEVSLQQELLLTRENLGSVESSLRAKIQELEIIIETQDAELGKSKTRVAKLEEGIAFVEERRLSLERKAMELGAQLEEKEETCEEMTRSEDLFEKRLAALTAHDEAIERKLQEAVGENQEFQQQNESLTREVEKLKTKIEHLNERNVAMEAQQNVIDELEAQNENLRRQISTLEAEFKALQNDYERRLEENRTDFDKLNSDWQSQFEEVLNERCELLVKCEKFEEELKDIVEKESGFGNELHEQKAKLAKSEAEIRAYEERVRVLTSECEKVKELERLIREKDAEIERKTNQAGPNTLASFFDTVTPAQVVEDVSLYKTRIEELEKTIERLELELTQAVSVAQNTTQKTVGNTSEESLGKIKTLEFMLFNAEKEKDEALSQGEQLTNEIASLLYERRPTLQLHGDNTQPKQEVPQTSQYFQSSTKSLELDGDDAQLNRDTIQQLTDVDSQILSEADIAETPETRHELLQIEFESTKPPQSSNRPIAEEPCTSKEAYLCTNTFGENDDGWGWNPDEAQLEEEHAQTDAFQEKIRVLEVERENHLEEIRQLQVKSGKLIKKLKEFKVKNDELTRTRKRSEGDLDDAIQEELKLQVQQVEKKLRETASELEKEKSEKAAILKRVDVLTAANERMVEMKEKQDVEMLGWQHNCRDLSAKLQRFQWGDDGFGPTEPNEEKSGVSAVVSDDAVALKKQIDELNNTVKDLALDNDELQALLEEQKNLRIEAEKSSVLVDYSELVVDKENLTKQLELSGEEKKQLQDQVNQLIKTNAELAEKLQSIEEQYNELASLVSAKEEAVTRLRAQIDDLSARLQEKDQQIEDLAVSYRTEKDTLVGEIENKNSLINALKHSLEVDESAVHAEKESLFAEIQHKDASIDSLRTTLEQQRQDLVTELDQRNALIDSLQTTLETQRQDLAREIDEKNVLRATLEKQQMDLVEENAQIESLKQSLHDEISSLRSQLDLQTQTAQTLLAETVAEKDADIAKLSAAMDQMTQEWQLRIDQRGNDVAESWKLHLESRESEFAQLEQASRKEIYELEEKTNALVNENNELRKNVDAEIRNEVDRVAALQQQINDRQQYIGELTKKLQETQAQVESLQGEVLAARTSYEREKQILDAVLKVVDVERDGESIVRVFVEKQEAIQVLRAEVDELKISLASLQEQNRKEVDEVQRLNVLLAERNQAVASLTTQMQEVQNLKDYENENVHNLQQHLLEYQQTSNDLTAQLQAKSLEVEERVRDVGDLRQKLEEKEREHEYALEQLSQEYKTTINEQLSEIETLKRRLVDDYNRLEEVIQNKEDELESVRVQLETQAEVLADKSRQLEELTVQYNVKLEEYETLKTKVEEETCLLDEESKQVNELGAIIEEQVLKIEQLKKELFQKSGDYDSLVAEMDMSRTDRQESTEKPRRTQEVQDEEDLTEPVSRAELDLALYMLHQRDVRCEELTVELTQLLEERDTLQLRLSNVIREKEELGRRSQDGEASSSVKAEPAALSTKLSELKNVGYKRDKTILDEQDVRRLQQMSIMQQHRDAASKLPPEAAARLVDASYTLSRDVQSPSKVLLNWLWGKSTPKVNNI